MQAPAASAAPPLEEERGRADHAMATAKKALQQAKEARDYVSKLDARVREAAEARAKSLATAPADAGTVTDTVPASAGAAEGVTTGGKPMDVSAIAGPVGSGGV